LTLALLFFFPFRGEIILFPAGVLFREFRKRKPFAFHLAQIGVQPIEELANISRLRNPDPTRAASIS